ncbi:MAG: hypothetical protein A2284_04725 [Deltaproteobacteria bacterium RIFOXYA12_FULL_61_11]|nr:MAG: hypothetical protein A2284_04725 [Deltaproteobacteria bacterium RIFOXYA12_FULL_61_11]
MDLSSLLLIAVLVFLAFEAASFHFYRVAVKAKSEGKKFFSESRFWNLALATFLALVGVLFLIFFVRNNQRSPLV